MVAALVLLLVLSAGNAFGQEKTRTSSIGMEFVLIPDGSFTMGADKNSEDAFDDEPPRHRVRISKPFYLARYEVTPARWAALMGNKPSSFKGPNKPVETVSWEEAQTFIRNLNQKEGHNRYRLPAEAEWEYAARAGTESAWSFGDDAIQLDNYAWYKGNSDETTHPVGQKQANAWGLHDMHGNVWEWVQDWYGENYYRNSPSTDPQWPSSGPSRVQRGGSPGDLPRAVGRLVGNSIYPTAGASSWASGLHFPWSSERLFRVEQQYRRCRNTTHRLFSTW